MYSADLASGLAMLGVEVHVAIPFSGNVEYEKFGIKSHLLHFHYIKKWKMKKPNAIYFCNYSAKKMHLMSFFT